MAKINPVVSVYHPTETVLPCHTNLTEFRHHCFPSLNLISNNYRTVNCADEITTVYGKPLLNLKKPLPCLFSGQAVRLRNEDPVFKLVKEKYLWRRRKKHILDLIHKNKNKFSARNTKVNKLNKTVNLPYGVVRFADHLSKNPDKNFKGLYNWYFDNAVASIDKGEEPHLVHAGGELLNQLYISTIRRDSDYESFPIVLSKFRIPLDENGPIFGVTLSPKDNRICVRQKNLCSFLLVEEYNDIENIQNQWFSISSGTYPFVSADIKENEICTVDANRQIKFWDISRRNCVSEICLPESKLFLPDKFFRIKFNKEICDTIIASDRKNVYYFDRRIALTKPTALWDCKNYVEMCEDISLMISSTQENHHYIGTTHSILYLDNRSGFIQKWSHMLPQTPSVGHTYAFDAKRECSTEMLVVGCQCSNEVVAIYNNKSLNPPITCLPVSVPSRTDTLREARANGVLYQPFMQNKFDFSLIGLTSCEITQRPTLFSLVSTGDIFQQKIEPQEYCSADHHSNRLKKRQLTYLEKWENNFVESVLNRRKVHQVITHKVELKDLITKLEEVEVPEWKSKQVNWKKIQKFSKKKLESYVDYLAPNLVNDFGILDDSEWEDEEEDLLLDISSRNVGKVESWLQIGENEFSRTNLILDGDYDLLSEQKYSDSNESNEGSIKNATSVLSIDLSEL